MQANGSIGLAEREDPSKAVAALDKLPTGDELEKVLKEMSPDQQKQLAQLYMFLTQHPEARVDVKKLGNVRQAMSANNQASGFRHLAAHHLWLVC